MKIKVVINAKVSKYNLEVRDKFFTKSCGDTLKNLVPILQDFNEGSVDVLFSLKDELVDGYSLVPVSDTRYSMTPLPPFPNHKTVEYLNVQLN